jgi:hypothetical protein
MKRPSKSSPKTKFPSGWNEQRVRRLIKHYESQSPAAAASEDDALFDDRKHTFMQIPMRLVPAVRKLLGRRAS